MTPVLHGTFIQFMVEELRSTYIYSSIRIHGSGVIQVEEAESKKRNTSFLYPFSATSSHVILILVRFFSHVFSTCVSTLHRCTKIFRGDTCFLSPFMLPVYLLPPATTTTVQLFIALSCYGWEEKYIDSLELSRSIVYSSHDQCFVCHASGLRRNEIKIRNGKE